VLGGGAFGAIWFKQRAAKARLESPAQAQPPAARARANAMDPGGGARGPKEASNTVRVATQPTVTQSLPGRKAKPLPKAAREELPLATREVRTPVVGPQNASVRIDGKLVSWFEAHQLTLGPHTFEFVPPNPECCEQPAPVSVDIVEGSGPQIVRGAIRFRSAVLKFDGTAGSRASCGVLGSIAAGSTRAVAMSRPEERLVCTIFPAAGGAGEPRRIDVDLRPGRTFTLLER
jgi:hypothetical protein